MSMDTRSYVMILRDSLEKKVHILDQIIAENEKQRDLFLDSNSLPEDLEATVDRKSDLVDELEALDSGFNEVFDRVKLELEKNRASFAEEINQMKVFIRLITDLSNQIQLQESRNHELAKDKFSYIKTQLKKVTSSQKAVNSYYKNMMKLNYVDPQFMDNKK